MENLDLLIYLFSNLEEDQKDEMIDLATALLGIDASR